MNPGILTPPTQYATMPRGLLGRPTPVPVVFGAAPIPAAINGLAVWLDAADSSSCTAVDGQVSQWRDKSGNGRHFEQTTANNRPTLFTSASDSQTTTPATINGVQGFYFDGINDRLVGNAAAGTTVRYAPGATALCVFRLVNAANGGGQLFYFSHGQSVPFPGTRFSLAVFTTPTGGYYPSSSSVDNTNQSGLQTGGAIAFATNYIARYSVDYTAAEHQVFTNSRITAAASGRTGGPQTFTSNTASTVSTIGALFTNQFAQFFVGIIGELLIYNRTLSPSEIATIEKNYLSPKWGILVA